MKLQLFIAALLLVANLAFAEDSPVVLEENQAVVQVNVVASDPRKHRWNRPRSVPGLGYRG